MERHKVLVAVLVTWLVVSFVPSLGLVNLWQRIAKRKG